MATSALVVVDVQVGQLEGPKPVYQAELVLHNIQHLLSQARANQTPVLFIQHDEDYGETFAVGSADWSIHPSITPLPTEPVVHKRSADAFHHTELHGELTTRGIRRW